MMRSVISVALPVLGLLISLAVLIAGFFGQWWLPLDVLSHVRLHAVGMALIFAFAIMTGRLWFPVTVAGCVCLYLGIGLSWMAAAKLSPSPEPLRPEERQLTLLSFNSWVQNDDITAVEAAVRRESADVVVLQEFFREKKALIERLRDLYPFSFGCGKPADCSMVMLAKHPIEKAEVVTLGENLPVLIGRFGSQLGYATVISVHTLRAPWIYHQARQVSSLADLLNHQNGPLIVAGDFNATPYSEMFRSLQQDSGLTGLQYWPTWPAMPVALPQLAIDHMFISREVRPLGEPRPIAPAGSDHLPILATFAISPPAAQAAR